MHQCSIILDAYYITISMKLSLLSLHIPPSMPGWASRGLPTLITTSPTFQIDLRSYSVEKNWDVEVGSVKEPCNYPTHHSEPLCLRVWGSVSKDTIGVLLRVHWPTVRSCCIIPSLFHRDCNFIQQLDYVISDAWL